MKSIQQHVLNEVSLSQGIPLEQLTPETLINDTGISSLERIELIMNIEDDFNIEIEDKVSQGFVTIKDIINQVSHMLSLKN